MKKFFLVLFLLPMLLFGLHSNLIPNYVMIKGDRVVKGDSLGVTITLAAATDTHYIKYIEAGRYNKGSLFLYGDVDSMVIKCRQAPFKNELANAEWDSLNETTATDTVKIVEVTSLPYCEFLDLIIISIKKKTATYRWYYDFGL